LGTLYLMGRGVAQDDRVALEWFKKAAEKGDAGAENNLASCIRAAAACRRMRNLHLLGIERRRIRDWLPPNCLLGFTTWKAALFPETTAQERVGFAKPLSKDPLRRNTIWQRCSSSGALQPWTRPKHWHGSPSRRIRTTRTRLTISGS